MYDYIENVSATEVKACPGRTVDMDGHISVLTVTSFYMKKLLSGGRNEQTQLCSGEQSSARAQGHTKH